MRIVHVSGSTLPSRDANGVNVTRMAQAFAAAGHDTTLLGRGGNEVEDDFAYYGVEPCFAIEKLARGRAGRGGQLHYAWAVWRWLRRHSAPDLLYGRHAQALALASALGPRVPMVLELHGMPSGPALGLLAWLARRPELVRVVAISEALRTALIERIPALAARIVVAHDAADDPPVELQGLDEPLLGAGAAQRGSARLRVGYVGHLYPGKGMEIVVALARRMPEVDFHVVGGTEEDLESWQARAGGLPNLALHGFVEPGETDAYRLAMDVLIAPYQRRVALRGGVGDVARWMSPLKIFEYMAAGRAIVASDLPVLREILGHDRDALLVAPDDVAAWQKTLQRLVDPVLRRRLGTAARARFLERHTWAARAARVLEGLP